MRGIVGGMYFDEAARDWDKDERRSKRAAAVAERLTAILGPHRGGSALDFGCGTGLLAFRLRDFFGRIDLLDPSEGMIEVLRGKVEADDERRRAAGSGPGAVMKPLRGTLESPPERLGSYDAIVSMLVFHHIDDIEGSLRGLRALIAPGGELAVIDLDAEDGSYHAEDADFDGRKGFDREDLGSLAEGAGFARPCFETIYLERRMRGGAWKEYPMFVMTAAAPTAAPAP